MATEAKELTVDSLQSSPMWLDVKDIYLDNSDKFTFKYDVKIHTVKDELNHSNSRLKVLSLKIVRDYKNNITDYIYIEIQIMFGDYVRYIYPNRHNFEVTLIVERLSLSGGKPRFATDDKEKKKVTSERYKAIFLNDKNTPISHTPGTSENLNLHGFTTLRLELVDLGRF
jgi:hypothetical protein